MSIGSPYRDYDALLEFSWFVCFVWSGEKCTHPPQMCENVQMCKSFEGNANQCKKCTKQFDLKRTQTFWLWKNCFSITRRLFFYFFLKTLIQKYSQPLDICPRHIIRFELFVPRQWCEIPTQFGGVSANQKQMYVVLLISFPANFLIHRMLTGTGGWPHADGLQHPEGAPRGKNGMGIKQKKQKKPNNALIHF